jgi:hypothetical protein
MDKLINAYRVLALRQAQGEVKSLSMLLSYLFYRAQAKL